MWPKNKRLNNITSDKPEAEIYLNFDTFGEAWRFEHSIKSQIKECGYCKISCKPDTFGMWIFLNHDCISYIMDAIKNESSIKAVTVNGERIRTNSEVNYEDHIRNDN